MVIKGYIPIEKVPPGSSVSRGAAFPAGPSSCGGGVMRIGRAFIIPAILALGVAGSALVGSAIPAAASNVSVAHVQTTGLTIGTNMFHHGHKTGLSPGTNMFHHG